MDFNMEVHYPYIEGSDHDYVFWFNRLMDDFVQTEVDEMDRWLTDALPPDGIDTFSEIYFSIPTVRHWDMNQSFEDAQLSSDLVLMAAGHDVLSVLFSNLFYLGGAHPGSYHRSVNYDFTTGRVLSLGDLFVPGAPYLERIAEYCIGQLNQRLDFEIWDDGATPIPENYQVWSITAEGLLVVFDEYQVAPYAAGPQRVVVPYDVLADIIHPQGPIHGKAGGN
jgi:hypothetical protein